MLLKIKLLAQKHLAFSVTTLVDLKLVLLNSKVPSVIPFNHSIRKPSLFVFLMEMGDVHKEMPHHFLQVYALN